jgi:NADPH-dependent 2,4-dienoyl-CoA reductase/sulfur reductase-like enzyme
LVVVGIGVTPATDALPKEWRDERGAVSVDGQLRVRAAGDAVFAAGDIAKFPAGGGGEMRIEHWRVGEQQGWVAARNMVQQAAVTFDEVPYFWSLQFSVGLDYVGHADKWDRVVVDGTIDSGDFTAYYVRDGKVVAAASCGRSRQMSALLELMRRGPVEAARIERGETDWAAQLCR